jgi:hypothetical protein
MGDMAVSSFIHYRWKEDGGLHAFIFERCGRPDPYLFAMSLDNFVRFLCHWC